MERRISTRQANQRFSEMLHDVGEGDSYVLMLRGRAVARVVPVERRRERRDVERLLDFLSTLERKHAGTWTRDYLYA
jgi:antitoxin (DNA-binding transcriptional repressor) of toxin-antitoxin stability system